MDSQYPAAPYPPPTAGQYSIYHVIPPEEPPPSYEDATNSSTAPLSVGPPPNYSTYGTFADAEAHSIASSDIESTSRALPEWVGQGLVVFLFVGILYGFWKLVNDPLDGVP